MSEFTIEGPFPKAYRTRDGRKAVVIEGKDIFLAQTFEMEPTFTGNWTYNGAGQCRAGGEAMDLIAPWDEPEQPAPVPAGITPRVWLAGMAMQGILANTLTANSSNADTAGYAVAYADALLKALEGKP